MKLPFILGTNRPGVEYSIDNFLKIVRVDLIKPPAKLVLLLVTYVDGRPTSQITQCGICFSQEI